MLKLKVERYIFEPTYTVGRLFADGKFVCDTLEDCDRHLTSDMSEAEIAAKKVYGQTAIPLGCYAVTLDVVSQKFKSRSWAQFCGGRLPRLLDVPGYDGVLIHVGNTADDTLGCLLVGEHKDGSNRVVNSTATFQRLYNEVLQPAWNRDKNITIEYI